MVLILTGCFASAKLVRRLADVVEEGGGAPVSALCVVMVSTLDDDSVLRTVNDLPIVAYGRRGANLPIHFLTR